MKNVLIFMEEQIVRNHLQTEFEKANFSNQTIICKSKTELAQILNSISDPVVIISRGIKERSHFLKKLNTQFPQIKVLMIPSAEELHFHDDLIRINEQNYICGSKSCSSQIVEIVRLHLIKVIYAKA